MGAIHQLLPARRDAQAVAKKVREETAKVFTKDELLEGHIKFLVMHDENRKSEERGSKDRFPSPVPNKAERHKTVLKREHCL